MNILNRPVLVLNSNWQAIDTTVVEVALGDVFRGAKRALDLRTHTPCTWEQWMEVEPTDTDVTMGITRGRRIVVPSVIMTGWNGMPMKTLKLNRRGVGIRDKHICAYSGKYDPDGNIDHPMPKGQGGENDWNNVVWSSRDINARKGNRTPEQAGLKLLRKPFRPRPTPAIACIPVLREEWEPFLVKKHY